MRRSCRRFRRSVGLLLCLPLAGCSALNRIDVCDQRAAATITVNQSFEGSQRTGSPGAMVPLPGGNALVVFGSEVGQRNLDDANQLRMVRLYADGGRLPNCDRNAGSDEVLIPVDLTDPRKQVRDSAFIAAPLAGKRTGLITYRAHEGDRPQELWGLFIQSDGCPFFGGSDRRKAFLIATVAPGEDLGGNAVVALGAGKTDDDFLVIWQELANDRGGFRARARVLRMTASGPVFLPTVPSREGAAVNLPGVTIPNLLYGMAPVAVGNEVAIAAHYSAGGSDSQVQVWFFDDRLQMVRETVQVANDGVRGELLAGRDVTMAYDGRSLLVGWIMNDGDGRASLFTRALDPEGRPRSPVLRVRTQPDAIDNYPVAMAWRDHGFLVSWRQQGGQGDSAGPRLLGRLIDGSGRPAFTAQACGEQAFVIGHQSDGDRRQPSIAALESNDVLAVWTDDSARAADSSGSSIQGRVLPLGSLFVGDSKPGSGKPAPAPVDAGQPLSAPDAGATDSAAGPMCEPVEPKSKKGGERCLCDVDCEAGASCGIELPEGFPGGMCIKPCTITMPESCGPGGVCRGNATDAFCFRTCTNHDECGPGRACTGTPRACMPYCGKDSDCRSGFCDPYRGLCHSSATPLSGKGALEPCLRHDDCRSRYCSSVNNRCLVSCHAAKPNCPPTTICVPFPNGDGGLCLPTCPEGTCFDPALKCNMQAGVAEKVCL